MQANEGEVKRDSVRQGEKSLDKLSDVRYNNGIHS